MLVTASACLAWQTIFCIRFRCCVLVMHPCQVGDYMFLCLEGVAAKWLVLLHASIAPFVSIAYVAIRLCLADMNVLTCVCSSQLEHAA
jgi:hypothetical protein